MPQNLLPPNKGQNPDDIQFRTRNNLMAMVEREMQCTDTDKYAKSTSSR
jgi:hypothetical protein